MDVEGLFVSPSSLAHRIRYALAQLRAGNGHHTFEDICREFSRARISRNVLPATGPVGAGGDQGRDFETFRSFMQNSVDNGFGAIEPVGRIAFTCTLRQERLADKIRSDLAAVMKGNSIVAVYAFCEANLPVSHRHELQEWAEKTYHVELEIIDGNGLAELLATRETFWIASSYLHFPASLAPSETDYGHPQQLPACVADFTGRVRELTELTALCRSTSGRGLPAGNKVVVITGSPGVGKSALVIRLARELAAEYPDGQLYSDLRGGVQEPLSPSVVLGHFVRALGAGQIKSPDEPAELAGIYRTLLANRRVLVVLDNAIDERQLRPLLSGGHDCLMLVTSRNSLATLEGATVYQLGVLELDESLELLASIAGGDRLTADPTGCRDVVQHCGRLPLAIRIAGSRLRARADRTPSYLAQCLADGRRRLDQLRLGDLDVRASFELSHHDLDPESRRLFRRLAVVPGPTFSAELAELLMDKSGASCEEALDRLIIDQLVMPATTVGYYRMHDLLRLFAAECYRDAGEQIEKQIDAMLAWYGRCLAQVAVHVTPGDPLAGPRDAVSSADTPLHHRAEAMAWLEAEADNLSSVLRLSDKLGLDLYTSTMSIPIAYYAHRRGLWEEWATAIEIGLNAARRIGDSPQHVQLLYARGELYSTQGDWSNAASCWRDALKMTDNTSPSVFPGTLHNHLAHTYLVMGRITDAEREMDMAKDAFAALDPASATAVHAIFQSELLMRAGQPERASEFLETHVLPVSERYSPKDQAEVRVRLASAYTAQGRHAEALRQLIHCRELSKDSNPLLESAVLLLLGEAYQRMGLSGRACKAWQEGLEIAQRNVHPEIAGELSRELGNAAFTAGDLTQASKMFAQGVEAYNAADMAPQHANVLHSFASTRWLIGDRESAEAAWVEAFHALDGASDQADAQRTREAIEQARSTLTRPAP